jgi:hypothetical protein
MQLETVLRLPALAMQLSNVVKAFWPDAGPQLRSRAPEVWLAPLTSGQRSAMYWLARPDAVHDFDSRIAPWWRMFCCVPIRGVPGQLTSHTAVGIRRGKIAVTLLEEFSMPSSRILPGACVPMLACYVIGEQATPAA